MVCKTCYLCIQMKINKNLYLFLLVCAWRNYGNLQKKLRTVVTSGRDWVRIGLMEDKDGKDTFYWIPFHILWFFNHSYVLPRQNFRFCSSHGITQVKSLQVSFLAPILISLLCFPHLQEPLGIYKFSHYKWVWDRQNTWLFYLISFYPGYTLFYISTKTRTNIIACIMLT